MKFHPDSLPVLAGKVFVVTGGTSGIGFYTVARLAQHGAHVYLCARSSIRGAEAIEKINTLYPGSKITLLNIDHLSLSSVVAAAKVVLSKENSLHGLINNAGIMSTPLEITKDGYEAQFQTNYIAHWLFTWHLLPLMLKTSKSLPPGSVRIVNLSSSGHWSAPAGGINFSDISIKDQGNLTRYGQSKLANVLHVKALNKKYGPESQIAKSENGEIWVSAVHPGLVKSNLGDKAAFPTGTGYLIETIAKFAAVDGDTGAWTSLFCAASPAMGKEQSGTYFQRLASAGWQSSAAKDPALAEKLEAWISKEMKEKGWIEERSE